MVIDKTDYSGKRKMDMTEMVIDAMASNHALIKQLGEALGKAHHAIHYQREVSSAEYAGIAAASEAYNTYLRERGE